MLAHEGTSCCFNYTRMLRRALPHRAAGGRVITVGNVTFYRNPNQRNATGCTDVPPDTRYSCAQQVQ